MAVTIIRSSGYLYELTQVVDELNLSDADKQAMVDGLKPYVRVLGAGLFCPGDRLHQFINSLPAPP